MAEIDTLQVKITANAQSATASLKSLASALQKVRSALTGMKDGVSVSDHLSKSLNEMNGALNSVTTGGIKRLQKLANALNDYSDAVKRLKSAGSVASNIRDVDKALTGSAGQKVHDVASDVNVGLFVKDGSESSSGASDTADIQTKISLFSKLGKKIDELWQKFSKLTDKTKTSTSAFSKFFSSLKRIAFYRAIRSALKAISEGFSEGLKNAYAYSKQSETFSRLADSLDRIKSITAQMNNQLGAMIGEIIQFLQPAIEWIVEKVRYIAEKVTEFMAAINGEDTYLRAKYEEKSWDDATDSVKKFKHQLLGLDELNNIGNKDNNTAQAFKDAADDFEEVAVGAKMKKIGMRWNELKAEFERQLGDWRNVLLIGIGAAVLGTLLLLATPYKALGLGLIITGGFFAGKEIAMHWGEMKAEIEQAMDDYRWLFVAGAIGLTVVGAALLFTSHYALGLGCILGGVALGATTIAMEWESLYNDITGAMEKYRWLFIAGGIGLLVAGAALLFTGHIALGLGCLVFGGFITVEEIAMNWNQLRADLQTAFQKCGPLFALVGLGSMVAGALLLFTGHIGLGLALLIGGGFLTATTIAFNWDGILAGLKSAWEGIKEWWNGTVIPAVKKAVGNVEEFIGFDLNGNGVVGYQGTGSKNAITSQIYGNGNGTRDVLGGLFTVDEGSIADKILNFFSGGNSGSRSGKFAMGGIPQNGSLFWSGESGAEFVGNIGNSAAVANTGQMTDAIYKAAYMGMSKALKENGGNGMAGFEPATTDDLFIAMRKKANNYNKMTGNSAFA